MRGLFDFVHNGTAHGLDDELHRMSGTLAGDEESESVEKHIGLVVFVLELLRNLVAFAVDQLFFIINLFRNQTAQGEVIFLFLLFVQGKWVLYI